MSLQAYRAFIESLSDEIPDSGFDVSPDELSSVPYDFQADTILYSLKKGKFANWWDVGLGKTILEFEISKILHNRMNAPILIFAPLGVSYQMIDMAQQFGFELTRADSQADIQNGIYTTNYERCEKFDYSVFPGILFDESSIFKSNFGKYKTFLTEQCEQTPYKFCFTATASPNDYEEIGNHAELLGICTRQEMLANYFIKKGKQTQSWKLKGYGQEKFWKWLASWAVVIRKPSDIGYKDQGFVKPKIQYFEHIIQHSSPPEGELFVREARGMNERRNARRKSLKERCQFTYDLCRNHWNESHLIWCNLNDEQAELEKLFGSKCVSIAGSTPYEKRIEYEREWRLRKIPVMITKPAIFGYGMNWQHCHNMYFVGLSDSYEQMYQGEGRCARFGQTQIVNVHIIISDAEGAILRNIKRKQRQNDYLYENMLKYMRSFTEGHMHHATKISREEHSQPIQHPLFF